MFDEVSIGRERCERIEDMADRISLIKDPRDRIGNIWALKMIAENLARLDEIDRLEGFLPVQVRPPVMLHYTEAGTALHALNEYKRIKGLEVSSPTAALIQKLDWYLGRGPNV